MAEASCGFVTGRELLALTEEAASLPRRDCHAELMGFFARVAHRVCAVEGPPLTGNVIKLVALGGPVRIT